MTVAADPSTPGVDGLPSWFRPLAALPRQLPATAFGPLAGPRPAGDATAVRRSAVLLLFGDDPAQVLLTRRAHSLRSHAGQVAFPGGAIDPGDAGPEAAALREAVEETGLDPAGVRIIGSLPRVQLRVTGWDVTPVLAWWAVPSPVRVVDAAEVAGVSRVPLDQLLDPANRFSVAHPTGLMGPGFRAGGLFVWGFTAMLLSVVLAAAGLERPWDRTRTEGLP